MPSLLQQPYTDLDDLFTQWHAFAVTNGWTQNRLDLAPTSPDPGGKSALSKGDVFAQWIWNPTTQRVFHFQSLAYDGSEPGANPDDAGPNIGSPLFDTNGRGTIIVDGPGTADFLQGTEGGAEFLVCIAEDAPDRYRMWMLGDLIKVGDWTGGSFLASQSWPMHNSVSADQDAAFDARNKTLFDGRMLDRNQSCTVHMEGVHGFTGKWGRVGALATGGSDSDRSGADRAPLEGPGRHGPWFGSLNWLQAQPNTGFIPLQPYPIHFRTGGQWTLLGFVPGLRGLRITFIAPREEFTLGGDVWKAYPWVKKSFANTNTPESDDQGIAFLKTP